MRSPNAALPRALSVADQSAQIDALSPIDRLMKFSYRGAAEAIETRLPPLARLQPAICPLTTAKRNPLGPARRS